MNPKRQRKMAGGISQAEIVTRPGEEGVENAEIKKLSQVQRRHFN